MELTFKDLKEKRTKLVEAQWKLQDKLQERRANYYESIQVLLILHLVSGLVLTEQDGLMWTLVFGRRRGSSFLS